MNFVCAYAQTLEQPREVFVSENSTAIRCMIGLPAVGNKAATHIELNLYGKNAERFAKAPKGAHIYLHGATLRHDLDTRTHSLHGGNVAPASDQFPQFNDVILTGRCVKDLDLNDPRVFRTTESGLMICNQTISVTTGKNQADLFNFFAMNNATDRLNNAELLANMTRKGIGITIRGRLVTDAWTDANGERKSQTKIQLNKMTLAPKATVNEPKPIQPQTTLSADRDVQPLWNSASSQVSADPWNVASGGGLPDLPGQYGPAPELDEEPF